MPQASTLELMRKLTDLLEEYSNRCTPVELVGALMWQVMEVRSAVDEIEDEP